MNVLILCSEFGLGKGGIQSWIFNIKKLLDENGCRVSYYAYKESGLKFLLKHFISDIYILSTWKMFVFIWPLIFLTGRKFFILAHGDEILGLMGIKKLVFRFISNRDNVKYIANSEYTKNILEELGVQCEGVVNPFSNLEIAAKEATPERKKHRFLTVSRLVRRKNIDGCLSALKILKSRNKIDFDYVVVGSGPEHERLLNKIKSLDLCENVILKGNVSENEKNELFEWADYFLLPSVFDSKSNSVEGFGIVFTEANARGLPVLGGNSGGMSEAIVEGVTGFMSTGDVPDLADKILLMLSHDFDKYKICKYTENLEKNNKERFLNILGS